MNENQHDRLRERDMARAAVVLRSAELREARRVLKIKQRALNEAIHRDRASWDGTPNIHLMT